MNHNWQIKDVIDLEFFLAEGRENDEKNRAEKDHTLYLTEIKPLLADGATGPRRKIRLWVEARRRAMGDSESTPGEIFEQAYQSLLNLLAVSGLVAGSTVVAAHLYYSGGKPINALVFFTVTVVSQVLILGLLGVGLLWRARLGSLPGFAWIRWLVTWLLLRIVQTREHAMERLGGERRLHAKAVWGALKAKRGVYGTLPLWPMLILTQTLAVFFNLGIIGALLLQVAVSNRAFGWESTLQVSPDAVYHLVETVALPWSWFAPNAHPTLEQVRESRIAIQGTATYPTDALVSWWPFLCYAVVFYGLLPRLILLTVAHRQQRRALTALSFDHADCSQLLRRMEPIVVTGPPGPPQVPKHSRSNSMQPPIHAATDSARCVVIASSALDFPAASLEPFVQRLGWKVWRRMEGEIDDADASRSLFATLGSLDWNGAPPKIAVIAEESQPPIRAILKFLRELRTAAGQRTEVSVLLIPDGTAENSATWKSVLAGLGDPYLTVERGVRHE